jgi:hypothetical protein
MLAKQRVSAANACFDVGTPLVSLAYDQAGSRHPGVYILSPGALCLYILMM